MTYIVFIQMTDTVTIHLIFYWKILSTYIIIDSVQMTMLTVWILGIQETYDQYI